MMGGRLATLLALAVIAFPTIGVAQIPLDSQGRRGLRDRYNGPQTNQKLDDNIRKLNGDDPEARLEAVRALGEINEPKAIEYLLQAANDPDMRIRIKAIDTLGNAHAKDASGLLIQQLFLRSTDLPTKQRILAALGKIGDTRATGPILDILSRDIDPAVRGNAIFALGEIGDHPRTPGASRRAAGTRRGSPDAAKRGLAVGGRPEIHLGSGADARVERSVTRARRMSRPAKAGATDEVRPAPPTPLWRCLSSTPKAGGFTAAAASADRAMRAGCVPRMPRWLRQPRHGSHAWYCPVTLASGSDPRHESRVALLRSAGGTPVQVLAQRFGDERAQQALVAQALEPDPSPEMTRYA
ncbi:MAG: HEAT repeat domain-containing protein, partial [Deltaproteobacteria bacterium]